MSYQASDTPRQASRRPDALSHMGTLVLMGLLAGCGGGDADPVAPDANQVACPSGWGTASFFRTVTPAQVEACVAAGESVIRGSPDSGETPLHLAGSFSSDPAVIRALIDAGARPDARNNDDDTALCVAVERNENPSVIQALLDGGSQPNENCRWGFAPLHMAARFNANADVLDALIRAGADVNLRASPIYDENGNRIGQHGTPIQIAAQYQDNPAVVDALVRAGADLQGSLRSATGNDGPRVLEIMSILISAGADLSGALHSAIFNAVTDVTDFLISAGADVNEGISVEFIRGEPIEGATPLHFAAAATAGVNMGAVEALLEAGADPNIQDSTGRTPLDWAESEGKTSLAELLRRYAGQTSG